MDMACEIKEKTSVSEIGNRERIMLSNDLRIEFVNLEGEDEDLALAMNCSNG